MTDTTELSPAWFSKLYIKFDATEGVFFYDLWLSKVPDWWSRRAAQDYDAVIDMY